MDYGYEYERKELLPLVSELAQQYTRHESTSITYERAQSLMEAVLYCIEECGRYEGSDMEPAFGAEPPVRREARAHYEDSDVGPAFGAEPPARREMSLRERYQMGAILVRKKAEKVRELYNGLSPEFEDYGVRCLRDTVRQGIPRFLQWYDIKFCPQDMVIELEYPLLTDLGGLRGVDAVYQYMRALCVEQKLLRGYGRDYVLDILERRRPEYPDMVENICGIVMGEIS